jgi:hypothetical protein
MDTRDFGLDLSDEEGRTVDNLVVVGEGFLHDAREVARQAEQRHLHLTGDRLPTTEGATA